MSIRYEKPISPSLKVLGENVRRIRKQRGYTQQQLCERLEKVRTVGEGWRQERISELESGQFDRVLSAVDDLARALKVPAWMLLRPSGEAEKSGWNGGE